jgi:hypothetical protein
MIKNPWSSQVSARIKSMLLESQSISDIFGHHGIRGGIRELFIKQFLQPFLPPHIGIGTGEIINHNGDRSNQLDVVLFNKERIPPILVSGSDTGIFPWESVVAVIEVKSQATSTSIKEAISNAASVHNVYSNLEEHDVRISGLRPKEGMKPYGPIPNYIFAFRSDITPSSTQDKEEFRLEEKSFYLGKEGIRLLNSRDFLSQPNSNFNHFGNISNVFGICVAGSEWSEGNISFQNQVFSQYGSEPIRIADKWNYYWETYFANEECEEVTRFLYRLLKLSDEMPKCRAHYDIARYFRD